MSEVDPRYTESDGQEPVVAEVPEWPAEAVAAASGETWRAIGGRVADFARFCGRSAIRTALPVAGAAAALASFPYEGSVHGIDFSVQGELVTTDPGISASTTFGNWEFSAVDGLPIGVKITPKNIDVLTVASEAKQDPEGYLQEIETEAQDQEWDIALRMGLDIVGGAVIGSLAAAGALKSLKFLQTERPQESLGLCAGRRTIAVASVACMVGGIGAATYNPDWQHQWKLTGTLADIQQFPGELAQYYTQQSKATDVLGAVSEIQAAVAAQIDEKNAGEAALKVMFISDMHLAANYGLVGEFAQKYGVNLIINTGDESEFGTSMELTPEYLDSIKAVTAKTPMLWLAGNHDSPDVEQIMRHIPGVTVVGSKRKKDDGYAVTAQAVNAFGLRVIGLPDPRVYGGPGAYGADDPKKVNPLERDAVDSALNGVDTSRKYDIFATHEPVAAEEGAKDLDGSVRQTNSGHTHHQNDAKTIQQDGLINLVEGSIGAGGLDNLDHTDRPPIELSIESVAPDCQFTSVLRFMITGDTTSAANTSATMVYLGAQKVAASRVCDPSLGIGQVHDIPRVPTVEAAGN